MKQIVKKAGNVVMLSAGLYRELALSALSLLPRRT
jgi:hypothetical protein